MKKEESAEKATGHPFGDSKNGIFISGEGISNPQSGIKLGSSRKEVNA